MPAYLIATMDVHDPARYADYRAAVPEHIARHGGRFIVRGGASETVEGAWPPGRIVVIEFPDYARAEAFADDPNYAPVAKIRHESASSHLWIVDGADGAPGAGDIRGFLLANVRMDDPDAYRPYAERVPGVLAAAGGTYLARGGRCRSVEGGMALDRIVLVGFADAAAAKAFHSGAAYAPLIAIRQSASTGAVAIVEGV